MSIPQLAKTDLLEEDLAIERAPYGPNVLMEGMLKYTANQRELTQEKSAGRPLMRYVLLAT